MKKIMTITFVLVCALCVVLLASCFMSAQVESYQLDGNGHLIAYYNNGTKQDLGTLDDTLANGVNNLTINDANYYVINGVVTKIKAKVPVSYELDFDGHLIVVYNNNTTENLGSLENDAINIINSVTISDDGYYVLNGVKTTIVATEIYNVNFNTGYSATIPIQKIKDGHKAEFPKLNRKGYTLDGWYCNNEKWSFNSDIVKNDMTLTAVWKANNYNVSFLTGVSQAVNDVTVTYDDVYNLPTLSRTGYTFNGWEYNGKIVNAEKWNIANDCELTASWTINKFNVLLNANGGTVEQNEVTVEYGKPFTLPIAENEYGAFIGWFYNDEQITDNRGISLKNWTYTEDIEVTTSWTINLSNTNDLQQLYTYPNGYFELKNDIDISANEWIPIGTDAKPFNGTVNGCNHKINGLKITALQDTAKYYGFIGKATSGKIYDITFDNINISLPAINNTVYVGGVIGYNNGSEISNVATAGTIAVENHSSSYSSYAGGIIGYTLTDKIQNCTNNANVSAKTAAGGILGYKSSTAVIDLFINNCNNGKITGATYAGGMIGEGVLCLATNCKNTGNITGIKYVGGLFGNSIDAAIIDRSCNMGTITQNSDSSSNSDCAGGLVGSVTLAQAYDIDTSIVNSYNQGNIISKQTAGGVVGYCMTTLNYSTLKIQNCYNSGNIEGSCYIGGIAGMANNINITQCVNFGNVSNAAMIATICYEFAGFNTNIVDCYYNCNTANVDSIQGNKTAEKFAKTFYTQQLFWSDSVWNFFNDELPNLK